MDELTKETESGQFYRNHDIEMARRRERDDLCAELQLAASIITELRSGYTVAGVDWDFTLERRDQDGEWEVYFAPYPGDSIMMPCPPINSQFRIVGKQTGRAWPTDPGKIYEGYVLMSHRPICRGTEAK